jgi:hypothetical protein
VAGSQFWVDVGLDLGGRGRCISMWYWRLAGCSGRGSVDSSRLCSGLRVGREARTCIGGAIGLSSRCRRCSGVLATSRL